MSQKYAYLFSFHPPSLHIIYFCVNIKKKAYGAFAPMKLHTFTVKLLSKSWSTVTTTKAGSDFLSLSQSCSFRHTSLYRFWCQTLYKLMFYRCRKAVNIPILYSSCMLMPNFPFSILALDTQSRSPLKNEIFTPFLYMEATSLYFDDRGPHCKYCMCRLRDSECDNANWFNPTLKKNTIL